MHPTLKAIIQAFLWITPWIIRRKLMVFLFKYEIHPAAYIGASIILAKRLNLGKGAKISGLNFVNSIDLIYLDENAKIGKLNWITGLSSASEDNFQYSQGRKCELKIGKHTRLTDRHFIDCTGGVYIGGFTTIAGINSVFLTHGIDLKINRQVADEVRIGDYCFIGTNCLLLKNTQIPDFSIVGAGAIVTKRFSEPYTLYGGNPAKRIKSLDKESKYFHRIHGHVN